MLDKVSQVAREMVVNGYGFRDDTCYNSGVENAVDVINYEVLTIGNSDILLTCRNLYHLDVDLRSRKKSVNIILNFLFFYYKTDILFAKWLTLAENVVYLYGENLSRYVIPKSSLIVSDLNIDGCLFVSDKIFRKEG